jgi:hypothetical protein
MIPPPRWSKEDLDQNRLRSIEVFRQERMREPLEDYLEAFEDYQGIVENLLEATLDLRQLNDSAISILTDPNLLKAFRYLAGPPISADDLRVLAEAVFSPGRLRSDPDMAGRGS